MAEPLLSSLCRICNTDPPKYRCPRCAAATCSLACCKRHKQWSDCNGIRDPTVYKPRHDLLTPAGIDHDYNFISAIERGIERTDKFIVEEKGLITARDLVNDQPNGFRTARHRVGNRTPLEAALEKASVRVKKAPNGMTRSRDNGTKWSKPQKCINWQVEWVRDDCSRHLGKILETQPVGEAYASFLEEKRRLNMTDAERRQEKKRKADEIKAKERDAKKLKVDFCRDVLVQKPLLQNPESSAWDLGSPQNNEEIQDEPLVSGGAERKTMSSCDSLPSTSGHHFYLHRPCTPSSQPRVLIPLNPHTPLTVALHRRLVLEFPTIYVLSYPPTSLPDAFITEHVYLDRQKRHEASSGSGDDDIDAEEGEVL